MRFFGLLYGFVLVIAGVGGMISQVSPHGMLFGTFWVNLPSNLMHITAGIAGLMCGVGGKNVTRIFFILLGLTTLVLAACGFMLGEGLLFDTIATNPAINWANAFIAATSLLIGFFL